MKILSVNIGSTNIVFDNCMWTGKEYIYVNGELVSKKFSWFGTNHRFEVNEEGEWVNYVLTTGFGCMGITADLNRNGIPIIESGRGGAIMNIPVPSNRLYHESELV